MVDVPPFQTYYARPQDMDRSQKAFYQYLLSEIDLGRYPSVNGNISYLFAYTYPIIKAWRKRGYKYVYDALTELVEAYYYENAYASYCKIWVADCLLAQGHFERYLGITTPNDPLPSYTGYAADRCNVFHYLGQPLPFVDFLALFSWKQKANFTQYTIQNLAHFKECFETVATQEVIENGPWLDRLLNTSIKSPTRKWGIFGGTPMNQPSLTIPYYNISSNSLEFTELIAKLSRLAENKLREEDNIPLIGEGWIGETSLYKAIKDNFPETTVVHHGRPLWLGLQHLDIWLPSWNIAVEYHGQQHFEPVEFFGGTRAFEATIERDNRKAELCVQNGVNLIIATANDIHESIIQKIRHLHEIGG